MTSATPNSGTWYTGDEVKVQTPVEAGSTSSKYMIIGYRCVSGGTSGTWTAERVLTGN